MNWRCEGDDTGNRGTVRKLRQKRPKNKLKNHPVCFIYLFFVLGAEIARVKTRFPNVDVLIFAIDFMFCVLLFGASVALAVKCNKKIDALDLKTCELADFDPSDGVYEKSSSSLEKAQASSAFAFLGGIVFMASAFMSFRRVVESRR